MQIAKVIRTQFYCTILIASFCLVNVKSADNDYEGPLSITLYHSLKSGREPEWIERGQINILNVVTGDATVSDKSLDSEQIKYLQELASNDDLYRLKAVVKTTKGREVSFLTFVRACLLVESGLKDDLAVFIDQSGSVIAVTLSATLSVCDGRYVSPSELKTFHTFVAFRNIETGPIPDTASYIQKKEREREAREHGETKDNRSFLSKYWMYIVPVVIFVVLSGASNPEAQQAAR